MLGVQMAEAALQLQIFRYRPHGSRAEAIIVCSLLVIPFPDRIEPAFDDQAAKIDRARRLVYEPLLARCVDHQESTALVIEPLAHFIHEINRIAHARGSHIAMRMGYPIDLMNKVRKGLN